MIDFNNKKEVASVIQYTNVKADCTREDLIKHLENCVKYGFNAAMINPGYVSLAKDVLKGTGIKVASIINFPLGSDTLSMKIAALKELAKEGADEFDFPPNPAFILSGEDDKYRHELMEMTKAAHDNGMELKAMLEFGYYDDKTKTKVTQYACEAGIDWVKNSSGGGGKGGIAATVEDLLLMRDCVFGKTKIKVSGKVNSLEKLKAFFEAGACLAGTSSGIEILNGITGDSEAY